MAGILLTLSLVDARKLILHSQRLHSRREFGTGVNATLAAIEHLGYVQLDTLSVVARAHLHTLWNRLQKFKPDHIDQLQRGGMVFEHWAHALAILPMKDYRFSLPMMQRIAAGEVHWYPKNSRLTRTVLKRIKEEGPLSAKDFVDKKTSNDMWARSPSKLALEQLFMEGELMVPHRVNFHKVYDLRERVLPENVDTTTPTQEQLFRHLITGFLRAHGIGQLKEMRYLRKGIGPAMHRVANHMVEEGTIIALEVAGQDYYCEPALHELMDRKLPRSSLRILSPFDNAVIQRKRLIDLFSFDYQIECYVQKDKRKFGYFCLPILHRNELVGRLDAKAERKTGVFHIIHLQIEDRVKDTAAFYKALLPELRKFAAFNGCETFKFHRLSGCENKPDWLD